MLPMYQGHTYLLNHMIWLIIFSVTFEKPCAESPCNLWNNLGLSPIKWMGGRLNPCMDKGCPKMGPFGF